MDEQKTRRQFLQRLGGLLAAGASVPIESLFGGAFAESPQSGDAKPVGADPGHYRVSDWTGDSFTLGHEFRNGQFPQPFPSTPEKTVDFVIIGGGLAGLTTAFYLNNHDFLLLEQYKELGGQSRGGSFRGIDYSWGPKSVNSYDGIYGQLYRDLGLMCVDLPGDDNQFFWNKRWINGTGGHETNDLHSNFQRLFDSNQLITDTFPRAGVTPTLDALALDGLDPRDASDWERLDGLPFSSLLGSYSAEFNALLDSVCKTSTCGTTQQISALAGLSVVNNLLGTKYLFNGGNSAIVRALVSKVSKGGASRLVSGTFVWKVELNSSGATVLYSTADGALHNVACKHVIITTPPMVAWRQMPSMEDTMKANLMGFKYGSYMVANCLLKKNIFNGGLDNWVSSPFTFSDLALAETAYIERARQEGSNGYKAGTGSVLSVYHPWEPGSAGRTLLLAGDKKEFAKSTYDQMSQIIEHLGEHLEEVVLTRWGHAMVVPGLNYFAKMRKIITSHQGPYTLAHNSTQGLPSAESAIRAARFASRRALATKKTSWVTPGSDWLGTGRS